MYYGWFSKKAADLSGSKLHIRISDGQVVEVTCLHREPENPDYHWDDKVFLGEISEESVGVGRAANKIDDRRPILERLDLMQAARAEELQQSFKDFKIEFKDVRPLKDIRLRGERMAVKGTGTSFEEMQRTIGRILSEAEPRPVAKADDQPSTEVKNDGVGPSSDAGGK